MYPNQAQFDQSSTIIFQEVKRKPLNMTRLQSGMFADRPDLWKKKPVKSKYRLPTEQLPLFAVLP